MDRELFDTQGFLNFDRALNAVHHSDCMAFMRKMRDKSVDFTLTDIPYDSVNRDSNGIRRFDKGAADEITFPLSKFVSEVYRLSKKGCVIFCGFEQLSEIYNFFNEREGRTLVLGWRKNNPSPVNAENMYLSALETAVFFQPPLIERPWPFRGKSALFRYNSGTSKNHPTEKNHQLLERILRDNVVSAGEDYPGDIIFDPCAGSGSHLMAALNTGCRFIGCELNETFFKLANERIHGDCQRRISVVNNYNNNPERKLQTEPKPFVSNPGKEVSKKISRDVFNGDCVEKMREMRDKSVSMVFTDISSCFPQGRFNAETNSFNADDKLNLELFLPEVKRLCGKTAVILCNPVNFSQIYAYFNSQKGSVRALAWEDDSENESNAKCTYRDNITLGVWFKQEDAKKVLQNFFKSNCFCYDIKDPENEKRKPENARKKYKTREEFITELLLDNTEDILVKIKNNLPRLELPQSHENEAARLIAKSQSLEDLKLFLKSSSITNDSYDRLIKMIDGLSSDTVLDPCCGDGIILKMAKEYGRRFYGCEPDPDLYEKALENLEKTSEKQMSDTRSKKVKNKSKAEREAEDNRQFLSLF